MIELNGIKGLSAWLVYNKVVFAMPFITENRAASRRFSEEVAQALALEDIDELRAFVAALPARPLMGYMTQAEALTAFKAKDEAGRKRALMECLTRTELTEEDSLRLLAVHKDANGISYGKANVGNLITTDAADKVIETLYACSLVDVDLNLVSAEELKTLGNYRVDIKTEAADLLAAAPGLGVGELLALAIKKCLRRITNARS